MDLYGVTIDGASPYPNPPLLQVDHVQTGVRIVSILTKTWYLSSFQLDHPVVCVYMWMQRAFQIFRQSRAAGRAAIHRCSDLGASTTCCA